MNGLNLEKKEIEQQLQAFDYFTKCWTELRGDSEQGCILYFLERTLESIRVIFHEWNETIVDAAIFILRSTAFEGFDKLLYTTPIDWKDEYNNKVIDAIKRIIASEKCSMDFAYQRFRDKMRDRDRDLTTMYWGGIEYDRYYTDAALCAADLTLVGPQANLWHSPIPDSWSD